MSITYYECVLVVLIIRHAMRGRHIFICDLYWRAQEFCSGGGLQQIQLRTERERGSGGGTPLIRGSGGSCNLEQEISFHIVKFS